MNMSQNAKEGKDHWLVVCIHEILYIPKSGEIPVNLLQLPAKDRIENLRVMEFPQKEGDWCLLAIPELLQDGSNCDVRNIHHD